MTTGQELFDEMFEYFTSYLVPACRKLSAIEDILPNYIDPTEAENLQKSLENSKEQGICDVFHEAMGELQKLCMFIDLISRKISKEEAAETKGKEGE